METMNHQSLFGGHMSAYIPSDARDVSVVREVPDNQEVFTHPVTDQSLIIEIMEAVPQAGGQAVRVHFEDVAGSNDALGNENAEILLVEEVPREKLAMEQCSSCWVLSGKQMVAKFNEASRNRINLHMAMFRLPQFETDILVSFNDPTNISPDSSSHHAIPTSTQAWAVDQFQQLVCSLKLLNTDLFGGDEDDMVM